MNTPGATYLPADGWYFTHPNTTPEGRRIFYRVALWRVDADGVVIGMIPVNPPGTPHACARLYAPPAASGGVYVHLDDLTPEDRAAITEYRFS